MKSKSMCSVLSLVVLIIALFALSASVGADVRVKIKKNPPAEKVVIVKKDTPDSHRTHLRKLPDGHRRVVFRGSPYYVFEGQWYRKIGGRFLLVDAPYGARVRSIGRDAKISVVNGDKYFIYDGVYYKYDDKDRVYIVVEKPRKMIKLDIVTLASGEVFYGDYLGGTPRTVEFETVEAIYEIDVEGIVSIVFDTPVAAR